MNWVPRPRVPATPTYVEGLVIFAALTYRVRSAPDRHGLFAVYLTESRWYVAKVPPKMYDKNRQPLQLFDLPAGSLVRLCLDASDWITHIQVLLVADDCPF